MAAAKKEAPKEETKNATASEASKSDALREPAERLFTAELKALEAADKYDKPVGWRLSPRAVQTYILGGTVGDTTITPKYVGAPRLVEIAISTLLTDRALLLIGEPGTAKSWLSEHLAAAIAGNSQLLVQGTAGTTEEQIRYSWNYALLLAEGPSPKALVPSPVYRGLQEGALVRFEEITRTPSEVQDSLITLLSEKVMTVPELGLQVQAKRGFNMIGTANTRDRGVNDMSAALKRRFNIVVLPVPSDLDTEVEIVTKRVKEIGTNLRLPAVAPATEAVRKVVQIFQELRKGQTLDGKQKLKSSTGVLSTAEAISLLGNGMALAGHFGNGVTDRDIAAGLLGAIIMKTRRTRQSSSSISRT
ncbi:MAG: AAA family ATPase [Polyangiaceae bacterium]